MTVAEARELIKELKRDNVNGTNDELISFYERKIDRVENDVVSKSMDAVNRMFQDLAKTD